MNREEQDQLVRQLERFADGIARLSRTLGILRLFLVSLTLVFAGLSSFWKLQPFLNWAVLSAIGLAGSVVLLRIAIELRKGKSVKRLETLEPILPKTRYQELEYLLQSDGSKATDERTAQT